MKSRQSKTGKRSSRRLHGVVKMRPAAKANVLARLPTAYAKRIVDVWCIFTGTKIDLCIGGGSTRKRAWERAAAS
jgi:hypothetical protein